MNFQEWLKKQPEMTQGEKIAAQSAWIAARAQFDIVNDVREFHAKFGLLLNYEPGFLSDKKFQERVDFQHEELGETVVAANKKDMANIADGLVDQIYVALGTVVMMGLPFTNLWREVHAKNMAKVRGITKRGHRVDVTKPPGWTPPDLLPILVAAGFSPDDPRVYDDAQ